MVARESWYWAEISTVLQSRAVWQILFLTYVVQEVETLLVGWLYFFGKFGLHVMISFGMTLIILQQTLGGRH